MRTMSTKEAKSGFGRMIDIARAEPVVIEKHRRGVVAVMAVESHEQLLRLGGSTHSPDLVCSPLRRGRSIQRMRGFGP
ncbi:MAG: type II toxin-antitoxin system Phd/YefM family antitoxin [Deltaproteobacteria bacterium]|nr:type II toxin-antitoxin system Phd/YefM family antitoxin [Deltaproteobacteria bacterium]